MRQFKGVILFFMITTANCFSQIDVNKCLEEIKGSFSPRVFQFTKNYLLTNSNNENTIYLINKNDLKIFSTKNYGVVNAIIDSEEKRIAISYYDKSIRIYDIESAKLIKALILNSKANAMTFDKEILFYGLDSGVVGGYNFKTHKKKEITNHNSIIRGLLINESNLLSISQNGTLEINNIGLNQKDKQRVLINGILTQLAISPSKELISIGTFHGEIYLLNGNYKIKKKLHPHKSIITKLDFIDNNEILSSSFDKTVISTNLKTNTFEVIYRAKDYIMTFDYYDDKIIFGSRDGTTKYQNLKCRAR